MREEPHPPLPGDRATSRACYVVNTSRPWLGQPGAAYVRVNHRGARAKLPFSNIELFDEAEANGWMVDHFHDLFYKEYPGILRGPAYTSNPQKGRNRRTTVTVLCT